MVKQSQYDVVYGVHPLLEIIRAKKRKIYTLYLTNDRSKNASMISNRMADYTTIRIVSKDTLDNMTSSKDHQGVAALVSPFIYRTVMFTPVTHPLIIVIDRIHDIRNLGAILRSAYCTKTLGVIITDNHSAPLNATGFKASAGLAEHLDIIAVKNVMDAVINIKNNGYTLYAAGFGGQQLYSVKPLIGSCIIVGNEEIGIDKRVYNHAECITIPQSEMSISFNVSVASGIIMSYFSQVLNIL